MEVQAFPPKKGAVTLESSTLHMHGILKTCFGLFLPVQYYKVVVNIIGLGDTEKSAPQYIMEVFITIIDIITILCTHQKCNVIFMCITLLCPVLLYPSHKHSLNCE